MTTWEQGTRTADRPHHTQAIIWEVVQPQDNLEWASGAVPRTGLRRAEAAEVGSLPPAAPGAPFSTVTLGSRRPAFDIPSFFLLGLLLLRCLAHPARMKGDSHAS